MSHEQLAAFIKEANPQIASISVHSAKRNPPRGTFYYCGYWRTIGRVLGYDQNGQIHVQSLSEINGQGRLLPAALPPRAHRTRWDDYSDRILVIEFHPGEEPAWATEPLPSPHLSQAA